TEVPSRVLVASAQPDAVIARAADAGVPAVVLGETGGDRLVVEGAAGSSPAVLVDAAVSELAAASARFLPSRLDAPTPGAVAAGAGHA
ncbi:MAG: hypothetical protein ACRDWE_09110, partial [Acidimicrobiales bacterium]